MINHKAFPYKGHAMSLAQAFGYLYEYEVLALQVFARSLPEDATVVNIGAGSGTSSLAIAEARPDLLPRMWTVDISAGGPFGGLENERNAFDKVDYPYPHQILMNSPEAGRKWDQGAIDFLFIDGDHSEKGLSADLDAWYPQMRPGGIMAFHDYDSVNWPDVQRTVDRRLKFHQEIMLICTTEFYRILDPGVLLP